MIKAAARYPVADIDGIDPVAFAGLALVGTLLATLGAFVFDRRDVR